MAAIVETAAACTAATAAAACAAAGHDPLHVNLTELLYVLNAKLFHNDKIKMAKWCLLFYKGFRLLLPLQRRSYRIFFSSCNL
jgi:hypothetical protein